MKPNSAARRMSLASMEGWLLNPPVEAQVKRNGVTPERRMENLYGRRRNQVRQVQRLGYQQRVDNVGERLTEQAAALNAVADEVNRQVKGLHDGTVEPTLVMGWVGQQMKALPDVLGVLDGIDRDAEAFKSMIDTDPGEWEADRLARFPALTDALPVITEEYLLGEDNADPLGGVS